MREPHWVTIAMLDVGQRETLGQNDSPWLRRMLDKLGAKWLLGQPWCGSVLAAWMRAASCEPAKNFFRARAWLDWGVPLKSPALGCVVVFERTGGGHVGLVVGEAPDGRLLVLGGNQGNAVSIAPFDPARVVGYRWPAERMNELGVSPLPVLVASGPASTNEA